MRFSPCFFRYTGERIVSEQKKAPDTSEAFFFVRFALSLCMRCHPPGRADETTSGVNSQPVPALLCATVWPAVYARRLCSSFMFAGYSLSGVSSSDDLGYRSPVSGYLAIIPSISWTSSPVSSMSTAFAFISRYLRRFVPGIGMISFPLDNSHERASCAVFIPLPYRLARSLPDYSNFCCFVPPVAGEELPYSLIWHPRAQEDKGHMWLRNLIVQVGEVIGQEPI